MPLIESPDNQARRQNAKLVRSVRAANGYIEAWRNRAQSAEQALEEAEHNNRRLNARIHYREAVIRGLVYQRNLALRHIAHSTNTDTEQLLKKVNQQGDRGFSNYLESHGFTSRDGEGNVFVDGPYRVSLDHPQTHVTADTLKRQS